MDEQHDDIAIARASALAVDLRAVAGRLRRRLQEQAHLGDMTGSQISVLSRLERDGPATVTTLAQAEGMRPQSMGAIVAVLEAAGHVSGVPDPKDGRQTILSLTPACRKWIRAGRAARQDWLFGAIRKKLTNQEQKDLVRSIEVLKRLLDP